MGLSSAVAAVAAAFAACTPLSGLTGGGDDSVADAAEASAPEAQSSSDGGGADAPVDGDAREGGFCSRVPGALLLCDDFERATPAGGPWDQVVVYGGALAVDPSEGGVGHELTASLPAVADGGAVEADLRRYFMTTAGHATLTYRLLVDAPPPTGGTQAMNFFSTYPDTSYFTIFLLFTPTQLSLVEKSFPLDGGSSTMLHPIALDYGVWHDAKLVVRMSAPARITFSLDSAIVYDGAADPFLAPGKPVVTAGFRFSVPPTGPLLMHVDDVTFDATP